MSNQQNAADIDFTNQVVRDYLEKAGGYESDEAVATDEERSESGGSASAGMDVDLREVSDSEGEDDGDVWKVLRNRFGDASLGEEWLEGKSAKGLVPYFAQLRKDLHETDVALCHLTSGTPVWPSLNAARGDDDEPQGAEDDTGHLAEWLGGITSDDVLKSKPRDIVWWLVDMCKALDKLEMRLAGLKREVVN